MKNLRYIFYALCLLPLCFILIWLIVVPLDLIQERIEDAVAQSGNNTMTLSVEGMRKGIFFSLHADSLELNVEDRPALKITDFRGNFSLALLARLQVGFLIRGKAGTGDVKGIVKLPLAGTIQIEHAELKAIPYVNQFDLDIHGSLSSDITLLHDTATVVFEVPDLNIDDSASVIPLLNTFEKLQGSLSVKGRTIHIDSFSLNGEKGYARLKGSISNNIMNLALELMPLAGKLNTMESMLIGRYIVSPGYYVVPIKGPLP